MDAGREREATPTKNRTTAKRTSERELIVTPTFNGPARIVFEAWTRGGPLTLVRVEPRGVGSVTTGAWDPGVRSVSMVGLCALALLLVFAASLSAREPAAPHPLPTVLLLYPAPDGSVFDRNCADILKAGAGMDPRWVEEAVRRAPEFQRRWDTEGPTYLATAFKAIGRPFPYADVQAALTVCPIASMSLPLIINVRGFLASDGNRRPDWFFPLLVFHELMHTYTRSANTSSPLRAKYASESPLTLNHLHVLALEKFVLTALGKSDELRWLDRDYRTEASPGYRRAWQIVNDTEGVEPFLTELRTP